MSFHSHSRDIICIVHVISNETDPSRGGIRNHSQESGTYVLLRLSSDGQRGECAIRYITNRTRVNGSGWRNTRSYSASGRSLGLSVREPLLGSMEGDTVQAELNVGWVFDCDAPPLRLSHVHWLLTKKRAAGQEKGAVCPSALQK